jgi:hypothetical protein
VAFSLIVAFAVAAEAVERIFSHFGFREVDNLHQVPLARDSPDASLECRAIPAKWRLLTLTFYWKLCIVA